MTVGFYFAAGMVGVGKAMKRRARENDSAKPKRGVNQTGQDQVRKTDAKTPMDSGQNLGEPVFG